MFDNYSHACADEKRLNICSEIIVDFGTFKVVYHVVRGFVSTVSQNGENARSFNVKSI